MEQIPPTDKKEAVNYVCYLLDSYVLSPNCMIGW